MTIGLQATAKAYFGLAGPMVISRLGLAAMGIADGVMLARFSTEQLALHGLADPMSGRLFEVAMAFLFAGLGLAAQARSGDAAAQREVGRIWRQALLLAVLAGLFGALLGAFSEPFLRLTGQAPALARDAGAVMFVLLLGMLPAMLAMGTAGVLEAVGRPAMVAVAVVLANVLNIGLNLLLIDGSTGWLELPPLGALGAALSTTIVRLLLAVVLVAYCWWLPELKGGGGGAKQFAMRGGFARREWQAGAEQRARGWSAAGSVGVLAALSIGLPVMAGWMGENALAQLTAVMLALAPLMVVGWGLCDAAGLRIAAALGDEGGRGQLRWQGLSMVALALLLMGVLCALYGLAPRAVLALAIPDARLVEQSARLLPLGMALVLGDMLSFLFVNMLRSLSELRRPFVVQLLFAAALLPISYLMAYTLGWGLAGLLAAQALVGLLRALVLGVLYLRAARALDLKAKAAMRSRDYGAFRDKAKAQAKAKALAQAKGGVNHKIEPAS